MWKLTGGATHVTDVTNASRTMLLDLATGDWDDELLALFGVDRAVLPEVVASSGVAAEASFLGVTLPVAGIAGDQQAALFGQGCFAPGDAKATYGTGTFVLVNLGEHAGPPADGLLTTAAAVAPGAPPAFAAEGSVLVGGAAMQWLRDGLGVIESAAESERLAESVESTGGVHFVPALTGLGSPQWRPDARGLICGITRGTTRAHLVRAALEAIAHQVADVLDALPLDVGVLRADGGATANRFLMQLQADLIGSPRRGRRGRRGDRDRRRRARGARRRDVVERRRGGVARPARRAVRAAIGAGGSGASARGVAGGGSARARVTADSSPRYVPSSDSVLNLESCDTAVFGDGDLDVLDDAVRQEDHLVLAGVERGDGVVRRHSLNVEVPATDRRDDDPDGNRFPLVAEPLNLLGELPPKEVAVEHAH